MTAPRVVVVGGGQAGGAFAALLRRAGHDGELLVLGDEAHAPYQRPPLSKTFLDAPAPQWLRDPGFYPDQRIALSQGEAAVDVDVAARTVTTSRRRTIGYDVLVLATGARPRRLAVPGATLEGVQTLRTLDDAAQLRSSLSRGGGLVVVGGGYVGLEVAAAARSAGTAVTVVEREERLLARVASPELSQIIAAHHGQRGTRMLTGSDVVAFEGSGHGANARLARVLLADGTSLECGTAVVGVGAVPCDDLARTAGITCAPQGGIVVDGTARTSAPGVLAIGDVTVRPRPGGGPMRLESIPSATEQAKQAVATVRGTAAPAAEVPWFWSDQFDLKLKIAGIVEPPFDTVLRGDPAGGRFALFHHDGDRLVAVETANANADFMAGRRLLADSTPVDPGRLADTTIPLRELALV